MRAIVRACQNNQLEAVPAIVISNNRQSGAVTWAREHGVPVRCMNSRTEGSEDALDSAFVSLLTKLGIDLIVLAGYMRKLGASTVERYYGRILNIHPALLPKFGGQGMYGRNVHEAVLRAGETESGVTIHLCDDEYDRGPIVAQIRVAIETNDTPESLAARIQSVEHRFYPETLQRIIKGDIKLDKLLKS